MTVNIHTPEISLYNLFGNANAPEAYESLISRCQLVTHISRGNATGHSKDADLAHIHMLYGDKVASLCESHNTYHAAGYTFAIMPYKDAQAILKKVPYTAHSFEPSVLGETIEKIKRDHYRILIPTDAPEFFRPVIDCINKHYVKGPEHLAIANMIGKHFIAIPKQHFDTLVGHWQTDLNTPAHHDLVKRLNDFNSGESLMDSQLRDQLNTLLGTPGENSTRNQLDAKAYICVQSYRGQRLSVEREHIEKTYGKEFAAAVNGKYQYGYEKGTCKHNHIFPLPLVKTVKEYLKTHPNAGKDETNELLKTLFQSVKDSSYQILLPTPKTGEAKEALPKINRMYGASQPIEWNSSMNDESCLPNHVPLWSLSMRLGQYEALADAWLSQNRTSTPYSPTAPAYPHLSTFKPRERTTDVRPNPSKVNNVVIFDFNKKERVR